MTAKPQNFIFFKQLDLKDKIIKNYEINKKGIKNNKDTIYEKINEI